MKVKEAASIFGDVSACPPSARQSAPRARFEFELQDHLSRSDAEKTSRASRRYAELFAYGDKTRTFSMARATK